MVWDFTKRRLIFTAACGATGIGAGGVVGTVSRIGLAWGALFFTVAFIVVGFFLWAIIAAPVTLDTKRANEVKSKEAELDIKATTINNLNSALIQKHPADEVLEREVSDGLGKIDEAEVALVKWLYRANRALRSAINNKFRPPGMIERIEAKIDPLPLFSFEPICPGNELMETDRTYYINPELKSALRDVLYPRPVTPPSA